MKRIKFAKQRRKRICWIRKIRSSRFANFAGKYLCWSLFFNKVAGLQLYYKRLQHRCFSVKFAKFLKTPFLPNTSGGYFWKIYLDRPEKGGYTLLVKYIQLFDRGYFFCWFRMSPAQLYNVWLPLMFL